MAESLYVFPPKKTQTHLRQNTNSIFWGGGNFHEVTKREKYNKGWQNKQKISVK